MGAISQVTRHREGVTSDGFRFVEATITHTGTYATGGDTLTPSAFGLTEVVALYQLAGSTAVHPHNHTITGSNVHGGLILAGTGTAPLVQVWSGGSQVANATSMTTRQYRVRIEGR